MIYLSKELGSELWRLWSRRLCFMLEPPALHCPVFPLTNSPQTPLTSSISCEQNLHGRTVRFEGSSSPRYVLWGIFRIDLRSSCVQKETITGHSLVRVEYLPTWWRSWSCILLLCLWWGRSRWSCGYFFRCHWGTKPWLLPVGHPELRYKWYLQDATNTDIYVLLKKRFVGHQKRRTSQDKIWSWLTHLH